MDGTLRAGRRGFRVEMRGMSGAERRDERRRALVIEDDDATRELLLRLLEMEGYDAIGAASAEAAIEALRAHRPGLVLLDTVLPGDDGLTVLAEVRQLSDVPVIFVSGRDDESTRVLALRLGADDYVLKPFSPAELLARVEAVQRRSDRRSRTGAVVRGALRIDTDTLEVSVAGTPIDLTRKEFDLLRFLASSPRQVFSREQLLRHVWGSSDQWQDPGTVTEHVRRLRRKLADASGAEWIRTVRGGGYRFEPA
jgi:two-component system phosphate regulon response regulator PhoB